MTGKLRQKVTVESVTQASDGQGGSYETWASVGTVFADVKIVKGQRQVELGKMYDGQVYEITMRYYTASDFKQGSHRFIYGSDTLTIHSVYQPDERKNLLIFLCSKRNG